MFNVTPHTVVLVVTVSNDIVHFLPRYIAPSFYFVTLSFTSFFYRFLRFSFTCIVSILCLAPHLNSDNLCSLFSSGPFLLFLRVSGANYFFFVLLLSLFFGPFHLHRATIFSLVSFFFPVHPLLLIRANLSSLCLSPPRSFHLFPFPAPFFVLCGSPRFPVMLCT